MIRDQDYDAENIFAKIIKGDIPSHKVYEDADVLSFMDAFPQAYGHTLVIPKQAAAVGLLDIDASSLTKTILKVQEIARAIDSALAPAGIRLMQFNGAPAGQTVFHLHFHLIPVYGNAAAEAAHAAEPGDPAILARLAGEISTALHQG